MQSSQDRLAELARSLEKASLKGAWMRSQDSKEDKIRPWLWCWQDISSCLLEAGELAPINDTMRMRTVGLVNRSRPSPSGTTRTFTVSVQHLNPGETTESHRHTRTSLYFMIQGKSTYTIAEGEEQLMETGDLLIQPSWTWHGTTNKGDEPAIWLTVQDTGLVNSLDAEFRDRYSEGRLQPVTRTDGSFLRMLGAVRPKGWGGEGQVQDPRFPIKYRWADTLRGLEEQSGAGGMDARGRGVLEYVNPLTGGPATRTMACEIQMLRPNEETQPTRQLSNTVHYVVSGNGVSRAGRETGDMELLEWGERDCFHIPPWQWHSYRNKSPKEPAILFSVSDRPLAEATGLYRHESG
jgi:gentisate 1,2-dioxygenase